MLESLTRFSKKLTMRLLNSVSMVPPLCTLLKISSCTRIHEMVCDILINCYANASYSALQGQVSVSIVECLNSPRLETKRSGLKLLRNIQCTNILRKSVTLSGNRPKATDGPGLREEAVSSALLQKDLQLLQTVFPQLVRMLLSKCITVQHEVESLCMYVYISTTPVLYCLC